MASTGHRVGPTLDDIAFSRARRAAVRAAAMHDGGASAPTTATRIDAALRLRALHEELAAARAMVQDLERLVEDAALALQQTDGGHSEEAPVVMHSMMTL